EVEYRGPLYRGKTARMKLRIRTALPTFGLLLSALVSCSDDDGTSAPEADVGLAPKSAWPKFRADAAQTGRGKFAPKLTGGQLWKHQTAKGIFSSAVIDEEGTTYIGSADRTFYAIDAAGQVKWQLLTGEIIDSSALLDDKGRV